MGNEGEGRDPAGGFQDRAPQLGGLAEQEEEERDAEKKERLIKALDSMIYMPRVKDMGQDLGYNVPGLLIAAEQESCSFWSDIMTPGKEQRKSRSGSIGRPWDRGELYGGLQTFKSMTWFAKPERISARECARRGWENTGVDELTCETCRMVIKFPSMEDKEYSREMYAAVVESFEGQLVLSHKQLCPWRSSVCSLSLLEFPTHIPQTTIAADFRGRSGALRKLLCLPPISKAAVDALFDASSVGSAEVDLVAVLQKGDGFALKSTREWENVKELSEESRRALRLSLSDSVVSCYERDAFMARVHVMALCGWSLRILKVDNNEGESSNESVSTVLPEHAALQCTLCGSRVGLWSMFDGCTPRPFSMASLAEKRAPLFNNSKSSFTMNHQVAMNMTTTIAGGMFHDVGAQLSGDASLGPFGAPQQRHVFGGADSNPDDRDIFVPQGKKRRAENDINIRGEKKKSTTQQYPSQSGALAQYRSMCCASFDPVESHRAFCPWVNSQNIDKESAGSLPGWKVYLENLSSSGSLDAQSLRGETQEGQWRGKNVFKRVLSSVASGK